VDTGYVRRSEVKDYSDGHRKPDSRANCVVGLAYHRKNHH